MVRHSDIVAHQKQRQDKDPAFLFLLFVRFALFLKCIDFSTPTTLQQNVYML